MDQVVNLLTTKIVPFLWNNNMKTGFILKDMKISFLCVKNWNRDKDRSRMFSYLKLFILYDFKNLPNFYNVYNVYNLYSIYNHINL